MATSGSVNFNVTRNDIIQAAARRVHAIGRGVTMNADMVNNFAMALNAMVKSLQAEGVRVWTHAEATLFPQASQAKYTLGPSSTDHCTQSYVTTQLAADAADAASTITVDSITGISSGDYIGIVVDDGSVHWTTVNGAPSGSTITLTDALDDSASEDARVYAYTTKITRPLLITDARRHNVSDNRDISIRRISRTDYQALPNKTSTGLANSLFYDPQLSDGYLYIWPVPDAVTEIVTFTWRRPIEDFDAAGDNPDLPQEWIAALQWNLALEMTAEYPVSDQLYSRIERMAARHLANVSGFDRDSEDIFVQPDLEGWD